MPGTLRPTLTVRGFSVASHPDAAGGPGGGRRGVGGAGRDRRRGGALLPVAAIAALFASVMGVTAVLVLRGAGRPPQRRVEAVVGDETGWEEPGTLAGAYLDETKGGLVHYRARRLWVGSGVSLLAGSVSGMLGVGGGFLKVPAMNLGMGVPVKVAAAASNFMIGVDGGANG